MGSFMDRQHSSRIRISQTTALTSTVANPSAKFSPQTYQIRVASTLGIWFSVSDSSGTQASAGVDVYLPANAPAEYFTVTPGQWAAINSTSTSSGYLSLTEMG